MPVSRFILGSSYRHVASAAATLGLVTGTILVLIWAFGHTLARNSDTIQASEFAAAISPSDPLARYRYASGLERTFDFDSIARSLGEYEAAVASSPNNFIYWIGLGQARERDGDRAGAERAYRRALELAPSYARTRWALGNNLVRQGKNDEGFGLIRQAVDKDTTFAAPAVAAAMQVFDGDVQSTTGAVGSGTIAMAELAKFLARAGRFQESLFVWKSLNSDPAGAAVREAGNETLQRFIEAKRFKDALQISSSFELDPARRPSIGAVMNGGFEAGVAVQNAPYFDWQIGQTYPVYGLSDTQPKEGKYSLLVRFATPSRLDLSTLSQTVAVDPSIAYSLAISYRSELTTRSEFRWEVVSAADGSRLAVSEPLANRSGWATISVRFLVPSGTEAVTFRLIRENCDSAACTVSGSIWFDDIKLIRT